MRDNLIANEKEQMKNRTTKKKKKSVITLTIMKKRS